MTRVGVRPAWALPLEQAQMFAAELRAPAHHAATPAGFRPCPTWCGLPADHLDRDDRNEGRRFHKRRFGAHIELVQFDGSEAEISLTPGAWGSSDAPDHLRALAAAAVGLAEVLEACP